MLWQETKDELAFANCLNNLRRPQRVTSASGRGVSPLPPWVYGPALASGKVPGRGRPVRVGLGMVTTAGRVCASRTRFRLATLTAMFKRLFLILNLWGTIAYAAESASPSPATTSDTPSEASVKQLLEAAQVHKLLDSVMT